MYKKYTYKVKSGTDALILALRELDAKKVIIPTYTCRDLLRAVQTTQCDYLIVDCDFDLQIDLEAVMRYHTEYDTIIVPHMFGIRARVEEIRKHTNLKIIEDLSQCHGLPELGRYADIVVASTNRSKWLDLGGGGLLFSNNKLPLEVYNFEQHQVQIAKQLQIRNALAQEMLEAGLSLIGKDDTAWLRAMYFTKNKSTRSAYMPLHKITQTVDCPKVEQYIDKVNWISIFT